MHKKIWIFRILALIIVAITMLQPSFESDIDSSSVRENVLGKKSFEVQKQLYKVVKVVDGDTVDVWINDSVRRIRLIGIDTPEVSDPGKPVQCFGKEASDKAKEILNNSSVYLENDPTQADKDKYQRLLRYIFLSDGTNFNKLMIKEGFAYEYTYDIAYKYQKDFKTTEKEAREKRLGLWGDKCLR